MGPSLSFYMIFIKNPSVQKTLKPPIFPRKNKIKIRKLKN